MGSSSRSVYTSKVDWWLAVLLIGIPAALSIFGIYLIAANQVRPGVVVLIAGLIQAGITLLFAFPLRYTLTKTSLVIRYGMCREEITYDRIRDVVPSANPLSAPALSLKRVKIVLDKGFRLISPKDRERFIGQMRERIRSSSDRDR